MITLEHESPLQRFLPAPSNVTISGGVIDIEIPANGVAHYIVNAEAGSSDDLVEINVIAGTEANAVLVLQPAAGDTINTETGVNIIFPDATFVTHLAMTTGQYQWLINLGGSWVCFQPGFQTAIYSGSADFLQVALEGVIGTFGGVLFEPSNKTLAGGKLTGVESGIVRVNTEGSVASDECVSLEPSIDPDTGLMANFVIIVPFHTDRTVILKHEDASGTAGYRFTCVNGADITLDELWKFAIGIRPVVGANWKVVGFTGEPNPALSDATPEPLGTADPGNGAEASRDNHVHDMPDASDVGADPAGTAASEIATHTGIDDAHHNPVSLGSVASGIFSLNLQDLEFDPQSANLVLAGPTTGAPDEPTFRALVDADIPADIARDAEVASAIAAASDPRGLQSFVIALAETFPRWAINNNTNVLSTGRVLAVSVPVKVGTPCTNASFLSATTAASVPTNWWFALLNASFIPIRQSTDQLTAAWASNTLKTLALDSIPVTAGARVASTTVTLTFPTLAESLTDLIAPGDSIVVSNANIAAYNGTFTVVTVTATQITYVSGGSATDSIAAPFPTVQLAAGKRVYIPAAHELLYLCAMMKATTTATLGTHGNIAAINSLVPILAIGGNTGLTGTVPSPVTTPTGFSVTPWAAIS